MAVSAVKSKKGQAVHYSFLDDNASDGVADVVQHGAAGLTNGSNAGDEGLVVPEFDEFSFNAEGWNNFKNIEVVGTDEANEILESLPFLTEEQVKTALGKEVVTVSNFVHVDADFSDYIRDVSLTVENGKRGNIATGDGDDSVTIESLSNGSGWSNAFYIDVSTGADTVSLENGNETEADTSSYAFVKDGRYTSFHIDLGVDADDDTVETELVSDIYLDNFTGDDVVDLKGAEYVSHTDYEAIFSRDGTEFTITADSGNSDVFDLGSNLINFVDIV